MDNLEIKLNVKFDELKLVLPFISPDSDILDKVNSFENVTEDDVKITLKELVKTQPQMAFLGPVIALAAIAYSEERIEKENNG